jgi:hypothetical protein
MPTKTQKEELTRLRKQFIQDLAKLREQYENLEISHKTGIDPGNLSSYGTGAKNPGIKVLDQFYAAFAGEIQNPLVKVNNMKENKENKDRHTTPNGLNEPESIQMYQDNEFGLTAELIATLKINNAQLRSTTAKMLDSSDKLFQLPYKWLDSFDKMVATHDKSIQMFLAMTEAHKIFLQKFGGKESV